MWAWVLIPSLMALIGSMGIWSGCMVALITGSINITDGFPFVSECADHYPQGPFLTFIMSLSSVLGLWLTVIRFLQVRKFSDCKTANIVSVAVGCLFSFGFLLLGAFQMAENTKLHYLASIFMFYGCVAFFWVQLYLVYRTEPPQNRRFKGPFMVACNTINTFLAFPVFTLNNSNAAMCEMILFCMLYLMFGLYIPYFKQVNCIYVTVKTKVIKDDHSPALVEKNNCVASKTK